MKHSKTTSNIIRLATSKATKMRSNSHVKKWDNHCSSSTFALNKLNSLLHTHTYSYTSNTYIMDQASIWLAPPSDSTFAHKLHHVYSQNATSQNYPKYIFATSKIFSWLLRPVYHFTKTAKSKSLTNNLSIHNNLHVSIQISVYSIKWKSIRTHACTANSI